MKLIKVKIDTGYAGCSHEDEFEVEDDATEEEINELVDDVVSNHIDVAWWVEGEE